MIGFRSGSPSEKLRSRSIWGRLENADMHVTKLPYKSDAPAYYVMLPKDDVNLEDALASIEGAGFGSMRER